MGNKILVVDDEDKVTRMLQILLEQRGYKVLVSHDGLAAYDLTVKESPDLVLSDLLLPRLHGFELCKRIRATPAIESTPVILMTAVYKTTKYKSEAVRYGASDFLIKPFDQADLLARIEKFVPTGGEPQPRAGLEKVEQELRALRGEYTRKLPERMATIKESWKALCEGRWDMETLRSLHRSIHGLAGSGATFGFAGLSDSARVAEGLVSSVLANTARPAREWIRQISTSIEGLERSAVNIGGEEPAMAGPAEHARFPLPLRVEQESKIVFLIDEDPSQAQDLALQLGWFGYLVRVFSSPKELEEAMVVTPPAAILWDVPSPDESPPDVDVFLGLQESRTIAIPLMFVSSRSSMEARLWAVRAGGDAYVTKPVDVRELIDKIDALTTRSVQEPGRVLIIEDELELADFYSASLTAAGLQTFVVTDPLHVVQPLSEFTPDLILMDIYMPSCTGLELARVIRQQESYVGIPIVFLSTESDLDRQVQAIGSGGDGFLTKPISAEHLVSAVTSRIDRGRTLRSFMVRDSLTGLLNHSKIKEQLEIQVARAQRQGARFVFGMIDIDRFKQVNDVHGHLVGDRVIKTVSRLLKQRLRKTDIIGRSGGDEFAVILPDTDGPTARRVMEEAREGFAQVRQQSGNGAFYVTLSCGIADFPTFSDPHTLDDAADKALYAAKKQGGNLVLLSPGSAR